MNYKKPLGRTSLQVSKIGLGLAALGRPGYINLGHREDLGGGYAISEMASLTHQVLDTAYEYGIRYFDTARSYGLAEEFLSSWLSSRKISKSELTVGSKWGYTYTADWQVTAEVHEVKEHSLANLEKQFAESTQILGKHLDLYQIHSATLETGVLDNNAVIEKLAELKSQGISIGLTVSGVGHKEIIKKAIHITWNGQRLFDTVQATWNLLERSAGSVLEEAHQLGLGVIIKESLANGRLTSRNQAVQFSKQRNLLENIAREMETTQDALAIAAALAQPWVDVVLSGAAQSSHLISNLEALNIRWSPMLDQQLTYLVENPEDYWKTRANLPWG